jgi:hypothetical protein
VVVDVDTNGWSKRLLPSADDDDDDDDDDDEAPLTT